jgi:hypothetical protein
MLSKILECGKRMKIIQKIYFKIVGIQTFEPPMIFTQIPVNI